MSFPVEVDTKLREGLHSMSSRVFICEHSTQIICTHHTPTFNYRLRFVCEVVTQWQNVHSPQLIQGRRNTPVDGRVTTLYTPWTTPSVTIARNSSAHAHGEVVRGGNFKHFKTFMGFSRIVMVSY